MPPGPIPAASYQPPAPQHLRVGRCFGLEVYLKKNSKFIAIPGWPHIVLEKPCMLDYIIQEQFALISLAGPLCAREQGNL